jgi:hypothetical protein
VNVSSSPGREPQPSGRPVLQGPAVRLLADDSGQPQGRRGPSPALKVKDFDCLCPGLWDNPFAQTGERKRKNEERKRDFVGLTTEVVRLQISVDNQSFDSGSRTREGITARCRFSPCEIWHLFPFFKRAGTDVPLQRIVKAQGLAQSDKLQNNIASSQESYWFCCPTLIMMPVAYSW